LVSQHPIHADGHGKQAGAPPEGQLRVFFQLRVEPAAQADFLAAYDRICRDVAGVDGHLVDQVCQSLTDPAEWVITSEWASVAHFEAWESSPGHRELAGPLVAATTRRSSLRYLVKRTTRNTINHTDTLVQNGSNR
jgi:heme-degrading monooxygenase HmoA